MGNLMAQRNVLNNQDQKGGKNWGVSGDPMRVLGAPPSPWSLPSCKFVLDFPGWGSDYCIRWIPSWKRMWWPRFTSGSTNGCVSHDQVQGQNSMFQDDTQTGENSCEWVFAPLCFLYFTFMMNHVAQDIQPIGVLILGRRDREAHWRYRKPFLSSFSSMLTLPSEGLPRWR